MQFEDGFIPSDPEECWEWFRARTTDGYGTLTVDGRTVYVHRVSYEVHVGPIPEGIHILHHCDNPPCVNPNHLFLGNQQSNLSDMRRKGRDHKLGPYRGDQNGNAKLSEGEVLTICSEYRFLDPAWGERVAMQRVLAQRYSVTTRTIRRVLSGENWGHLEEVVTIDN